MIGSQGHREGVGGVLGNRQISCQDVPRSHGDDSHAHARPCHPGRDRAHGPVPARGDDDRRTQVECAHSLTGAGVLGRGFEPVDVVDSKGCRLFVDEVLEGLGVGVLGGVHDDPRARAATRWVVGRGGGSQRASPAAPTRQCGRRAGNSDGTHGTCRAQYPSRCVHVYRVSLQPGNKLWIGR